MGQAPYAFKWFIIAAAALLLTACSDTDENPKPIVVGEDANVVEEDVPLLEYEPVVEILADTNRNGIIDFDDPSESMNKDTWGPDHGAIFLANIDDDARRCPIQGSDTALAACNDAEDEIVNGEADLLDLARIKTRPWIDAPEEAFGTLDINENAAPFVRIFKNVGRTEAPESFEVFNPQTDRVSAESLRLGVEFAIEGKGVITDRETWDGLVDLTWTIQAAESSAADAVQLRQAPVILRHHLDAAERVYVTRLREPGSAAFRADLSAAAAGAGVAEAVVELRVEDQWTQDFFENGYMAMPSVNGQQVIQVYFRSANIEYPESLKPVFEKIYAEAGMAVPEALREAGRVVFTHFRGPGVAGVAHYHPDKGQAPLDMSGYDLDDVVDWFYGESSNHYPELATYIDNVWEVDTLDSFGNTETIPPYAHGGKSYPLGRVLRGMTQEMQPDPLFKKLLESQGIQEPLYLDTSWLAVAHVDETVSFVKSDSPRGWAMAINDPVMARAMLIAERDRGHGEVSMFVGKFQAVDFDRCTQFSCPDPDPATVTINEVLDDPDVMAASAEAALEIDDQLQILRQETGLTDDELILVPFLHEHSMGGSLAYQPGTVNGISLAPDEFGPPEPHGPVIDGVDIMKVQMEEAFGEHGVKLHWIENWDLYHVYAGEVHCGSNVRRAVSNDFRWWENTP